MAFLETYAPRVYLKSRGGGCADTPGNCSPTAVHSDAECPQKQHDKATLVFMYISLMADKTIMESSNVMDDLTNLLGLPCGLAMPFLNFNDILIVHFNSYLKYIGRIFKCMWFHRYIYIYPFGAQFAQKRKNSKFHSAVSLNKNIYCYSAICIIHLTDLVFC